MKLLQLAPRGMLSSEHFEFLRYLHSKDMRNFHFLVFLTVRTYLKFYFHENYSAYRTFNADFRPVGIFKLSLTVKEI